MGRVKLRTQVLRFNMYFHFSEVYKGDIINCLHGHKEANVYVFVFVFNLF